jgi:hypothetical protein
LNIPENGRIIIVDDKLEDEAKPLIEALSKNGIAVRFFTGRASGLPRKPLTGVRLLFLDMVLEGMDFTMETDKIVKSLIPVIQRLISPQNGPYVILGWTKSPQHLQALVNALSTKPVAYADMEKSDCFSEPAKVLAKIETKLQEKLRNLGALQVLFRWENLVHRSAHATVNEFYGLCEKASEPNDALSLLLCRLARAGLGKQMEQKSPEVIIANSLLCFNGPFFDTLERNLHTADFKDIWTNVPKIARDQQELEIVARINTQIHLCKCYGKTAVPGTVYKAPKRFSERLITEMVQDAFDLSAVRRNYIQRQEGLGVDVYEVNGRLKPEHEKAVYSAGGEQAKGIKQVAQCYLVEISPFCDYAQKKWKMHRFVPCILWPANLMEHLKRNTDFLQVSPCFILDSCFAGPFYLVFDFRHFHSQKFEFVGHKKPAFRLRKDLVNEIQNRLARHVNRLGILEL